MLTTKLHPLIHQLLLFPPSSLPHTQALFIIRVSEFSDIRHFNFYSLYEVTQTKSQNPYQNCASSLQECLKNEKAKEKKY